MSRRIRATVLLAVLLTLFACDVDSQGTTSPDMPTPGNHSRSIEWQGEQRTYLVHAPPNYEPATRRPLVVVMHAYPGTAAQAEAVSGMSTLADKEGFLVLYPEGLNGGFNALICCGNEDDVGLIKALVTYMVDTWHADPTRVYATGISNGADMSYRLAVELPKTFAAIAPVSGGFGGIKTQQPDYRPSTPVSVITFIGERDHYYDAFVAGIQRWQQLLACEPKGGGGPTVPDGITVGTYTCADGSDIVTYSLPQMGHRWPAVGAGDSGLDATGLIWQFFSAHVRTTN
jgi:polyhydroxybutyrate depolymerase